MIPLYAPAQVRGMDERAFGRGVSSLALMEAAAGHLARAVLRLAGRGYGLEVGVLCGKGNNGGDGLAAARRLADAGAHPAVHLVAGADGLSGDAGAQLRAWLGRGGRLSASVEEALAGADVAVDCLLGSGARGEPREPYRSAVAALDAFDGPVVACDLPSGVDGESGEVPGEAVRADLTVTLGAHKAGLWLWPARGYAGRIVLGDLGIVDGADRPCAHLPEAADVAAWIPEPPPEAHKRSRGVVVVFAGSPGMTGAATLVARGALAGGAGLVVVATSAQARALVAPTVPEALTVAVPDDDPDAAFEVLAGRLEAADALAAGPGLGIDEATVSLVRRLVREVDVPIVLDADGVNAFRHDGDALADHATGLLALTPHEREFARLFPPADRPAWGRRLRAVPEAAGSWRAVVVAKGPGSLTAAPDGRLWVNPTGSAALATGGTGDVLTGLAGALVAQRPDAASLAAAVYVHGLAGQAAAERSHARSVTALDVAAAIPAGLRRLEGR